MPPLTFLYFFLVWVKYQKDDMEVLKPEAYLSEIRNISSSTEQSALF